MGCSQIRRELLEHFAFREELGARSAPHLAHLESCAECRREMGIDRALIVNLRRALRERVAGSAPSVATWELVRRRTVGRPFRPWTARVPQWGGMVSAAAAGIMMFAVATAPETRLVPGTQSPVFVASAAKRAVPVEEAPGWPPAYSTTYVAPEAEPPLPGWPMRTHLSDDQMSDEVDPRDDAPPIPRRTR